MARRRRHLPRMAGHSAYRGHYRHNPAKSGGISWLPMVAIAAGAFLLMKPGGLGGVLGTGTSVAPAGYTYLGSGYYRGPDGQTYYRSPTTGQMAPATAGQVATGQVTQAGQQVLTGILPSVVSAATSLFDGLIKSAGGWFTTEQAPLTTSWGTVGGPIEGMGGAMPTQESLFAAEGGSVGWAPAPLPEFPDLTLTSPLWASYGSDSYQMSLELQPTPISINGSDQAGWW